eukprot:scaffold7859_cov112-Isochrysis_galbana.AAC.2
MPPCAILDSGQTTGAAPRVRHRQPRAHRSPKREFLHLVYIGRHFEKIGFRKNRMHNCRLSLVGEMVYISTFQSIALALQIQKLKYKYSFWRYLVQIQSGPRGKMAPRD